MTWVYDHTESVPLAQLMHAMYTGTLVVVSPALGFTDAALWQLPFTLLLWLLVTTIYLAGRRKVAHNW
jgi:cytochrome c-type biogenesis protein CcmH/NrfF